MIHLQWNNLSDSLKVASDELQTSDGLVSTVLVLHEMIWAYSLLAFLKNYFSHCTLNICFMIIKFLLNQSSGMDIENGEIK